MFRRGDLVVSPLFLFSAPRSLFFHYHTSFIYIAFAIVFNVVVYPLFSFVPRQLLLIDVTHSLFVRELKEKS